MLRNGVLARFAIRLGDGMMYDIKDTKDIDGLVITEVTRGSGFKFCQEKV